MEAQTFATLFITTHKPLVHSREGKTHRDKRSLIERLWFPFALVILQTLIVSCAEQAPDNENQSQCVRGFEKCILLSGKLNEEHVQKLYGAIGEIDLAVINSGGGRVDYGRRIGAFLHEHELPLMVAGECSSACAEYIMPGAQYVLALDGAIFKFHGNSLITRDIAYVRGYSIEARCPWKGLDWLEYIYSVKGLNYEFVDMQVQAIGPPKVEFVKKPDGCLKYTRYELPTEDWSPSIDIMRDVWGLDIRRFDLRG